MMHVPVNGMDLKLVVRGWYIFSQIHQNRIFKNNFLVNFINFSLKFSVWLGRNRLFVLLGSENLFAACWNV